MADRASASGAANRGLIPSQVKLEKIAIHRSLPDAQRQRDSVENKLASFLVSLGIVRTGCHNFCQS